MKRFILISFLCSGLLLNANNETKEMIPFGIKLGSKLDNNIKGKMLIKDKYVIKPPKAISLFKNYSAYIDQNNDVIGVSAIGQTFKNDDYCSGAKNQYSNLKDIISKKYGQVSKEYEFLKSGALWDKSREFKMSLRKNERYHQSYWEVDRYTIILEIDATSRGCYVVLDYRDEKLVNNYLKNQNTANADSL